MLRKLNESIDRFCAMHPRFGIPNLMLYIVIGNAVVFFLSMFSSSAALSFLALDPAKLLHGELWRLVTFIFVPDSGSVIFLLIALYFYYFIGSTLERNWGSGKFTIYYGSGVVLSVLVTLLGYWLLGYTGAVGGTGYVNLSMFFAFAMLYPDMQVLLFFIIPVKIKWLAYVDAAFFLFGIVSSLIAGNFVGALLPVVALLNFLIFFSPSFHRMAQQEKSRFRPQAQQYRRTVQQAQQETKAQAQRGYHHKCSVCGRTDAEFPELQFRYCSRCAGYHCFCADHIFNHVHFTEETEQ